MTLPGHAPTDAWGSIHLVRAEILVEGGTLVTGDLHLFASARDHAGPETPADLLNRDETFFAITEANGQTLILSRRQVLMVRLEAEPVREDPDRLLAARTIEVGVELTDGTAIQGTVTSELPPRRPRALDYLNHRRGFFPLQSPDALRLINRDHVRFVTPLD